MRRGGQVILDGLTFGVGRGKVTGLLGPSGCGKTTLMRALVGVQTITAGGDAARCPAGHPKLRARVGYATQESAVYSDLTLVENLRYFGTVLGLRKRRLAAVIAATIGELDLSGLEGRVVSTFSGGQFARVGLAVALLGRPDLLVLDEPTVGLDPVLRRDLWELFHDLAAAGTALLVSSHVMDEAARCDYLLFMREGRFLAEAPPAEILAKTGATDLESAFSPGHQCEGAGGDRRGGDQLDPDPSHRASCHAQLRHDPRTIVMMLAVPAVLMILLRYVLDNPLALDRFAPVYIGVFPS